MEVLPLLCPESGDRPAFVPPMYLGKPEGEHWVRLADLAQPPVLAGALARMAEVRGYPDPITIGAGFALVSTGALAEQAYRFAEGADVPVLHPEQTWWRLMPSANVTAVAVEEPPAFVAPERLAEALHAGLDDLYSAIHAQTRVPVRGQWAMLASVIGAWFLRLMPADPERAVAASEALFATDAQLSATRPRVTWFEAKGRRRAFTTRRMCCFNYRGRGGHYCDSQCPIVPAAERLALAVSEEPAS